MLNCPICNKEVKKGEFLTVGHDAIGSYIVEHLVPVAEGQPDYEFYSDPANSLKVGVLPGDQNLREYCGLAGFKGIDFTGGNE